MAAPGISSLVEDREEMEIDYPKGKIRNVRSGKELPLPKYSPWVEQILKAGGILSLLKERCVKKGLVQ